MMALRSVRAVARGIHTSARVMQDAAKAGAAAPAVNPSDPEFAPRVGQTWINDYWTKRGYKVADPKTWKGWDDIPADTKNPDASGADLTGYFKYATVKMDPAHVLNHGPVWKFFSDWRTAIPAAVTLTLPLWMYQVLPPLDERMLLAGIGISAGLVFIKAAGPLLASMKSSHRGARARALLEAEKSLNDGIADALDTFKAGSSVVEYVKSVNDAERALRALEASAATKRIALAQREALVGQLDYLVQISASGAAGKEAAVIKAARANVEAALEKDAGLQQRTIDAAVKALKEGATTEDVVGPLFSKALEKAKADEAAKPAAKPLTDRMQVEIFRKRFGLTEDAVTEVTLQRAKADKAAFALLTGKVGGAEPAVGAKYLLKPAIAYAK